jgi:hypothetical protein
MLTWSQNLKMLCGTLPSYLRLKHLLQIAKGSASGAHVQTYAPLRFSPFTIFTAV